MVGNCGESLEPKWTSPTIAANHPIRRAPDLVLGGENAGRGLEIPDIAGAIPG